MVKSICNNRLEFMYVSIVHMNDERMVCKMKDCAITKECGLPMDTSLRGKRLRKYPLQVTEDILVYDRLETEGIVLLYENIGGACYMPMCYDELGYCENMALIAAISVSVYDHEVYTDRYFFQSGYEEYIPLLFNYVDTFASFYNYGIGILDLRK